MTAHLGLGQQLQRHLQLPLIPWGGLTVQGDNLYLHLTVPLLAGLGDLNDLREGHRLMAGGQPAPLLLEQKIQLHHALKNQLRADELALCTNRLDPGGQQTWRLAGARLEPHLVGKGEGLLLNSTQLEVLPRMLALADVVLLRLSHAAADRPLHRLAGRDIYCQVHPQQNLSRIQRPGLCAAQARAGQHCPRLSEPRGLQLAGKGQPYLDAPQSAAPLGLV